MSTGLKLAIFDVDGTLVDSLGHIYQALRQSCQALDLPVPARATVRGAVGLSLPVMMEQLIPGLAPERRDALVEGYKQAYSSLRSNDGAASSPLFPGISEMLALLQRHEMLLLGVATGKSQRGLDHVLQMHGLERLFVTRQVADHHPSKPHPAMLHAALGETGCEAAEAVMIGDTSFDMEMAKAAGIASIAVGWGYHPTEQLAALSPTALVQDVAELAPQILRILEMNDE